APDTSFTSVLFNLNTPAACASRGTAMRVAIAATIATSTWRIVARAFWVRISRGKVAELGGPGGETRRSPSPLPRASRTAGLALRGRAGGEVEGRSRARSTPAELAVVARRAVRDREPGRSLAKRSSRPPVIP